MGFGKSNNLGEGLDEMALYRRNGIVDPQADLSRSGIAMSHDSPIILGNFVDIERPVYRPVGAEV